MQLQGSSCLTTQTSLQDSCEIAQPLIVPKGTKQQLPTGMVLGSSLLQGMQLLHRRRRRASAGLANPKMPKAPPKRAAPAYFRAWPLESVPLASPIASPSIKACLLATWSRWWEVRSSVDIAFSFARGWHLLPELCQGWGSLYICRSDTFWGPAMTKWLCLADLRLA